jgi:hypothetical protein
MAIFKKTSTTPATVPGLADVSPDHAALVTRRGDLRNTHAALGREAAGLWDRQFQRLPDGGRAERVASLLGDDPIDVPDKPSRLETVRQQQHDIELALSEIERRIGQSRIKASGIICEQIKSTYNQRAAAVANALIAAHKAQVDLADLVGELESKDVAWAGRLQPLSVDGILGDPLDTHSRLSWLLKECAAAGFIAKSDIPEEVRQ